MKYKKIIFAAIFSCVIIVLAVTGNSYLDEAVSNAAASVSTQAYQPVEKKPKTSTMALPARTNNAWEMDPFMLDGLDGLSHQLSEWKGKVIVMNFWASWCSPCMHEIPDFIQHQEQYADSGLQIIGIGVDEKRKLANVKRTLGINYPVLILDPMASRPFMAKWGNSSGIIPYTIVINTDGRMKYIHRGQMGNEEFNEYVLPLLKPVLTINET